ncbi:phosphatase PAP2 family protein [Endozoicomonas sp. GU-1]|uniref:phosphatase PAP2 family protein n=1 Tax=Endozoicomonas sp. GU-1 TaxID=3009078 RepID=UPI0022B32E6A|nr:phosphatase PAP2 family protein [Endozoicomonas sp. GU-1]WBA81823.1 phosphatase PAP2 family protein [Endozoicomonas sp. GU-1]WBA84777.1 phosphatase PAP2 family protein [Endozoicomonas sp. GU-1]
MNIVSTTPLQASGEVSENAFDQSIHKPDDVKQFRGFGAVLRSGVTSILQRAGADDQLWLRQAQEAGNRLMTRLMSAVPVVYSLLIINSLPTANGCDKQCEWGCSGSRNGTLSANPHLGFPEPEVEWADGASDVVLYGGCAMVVASHIARFVARLYAGKQSSEQVPEPGRMENNVKELAKKMLRREASEVVKSVVLVASVVGVIDYLKMKIDRERPYVLNPDYIHRKLCMDPDDFKAMPSGHASVSAIAWSQVVLNVIDTAAMSSQAFKRLLSKMAAFSNQPLSSPAGKRLIAFASAMGFGALAGALRVLAAKHDVIDVSVGAGIGIIAAACSPYIRSGVFNHGAVVNEKTGYYYDDEVYSRPVEAAGPMQDRDYQKVETTV